MSQPVTLHPIGFVQGGRREPEDDHWGNVPADIVLDPGLPAESLAGLDQFSHVLVVYYFDQVDPARIESGARHPRNRTDWPKVGIFAQRGKNRPNQLGVTACRLLGVEGRTLHVEGLDAVSGTPVLDLKPVFREFEPRGPIRQPPWVSELMRNYW